MLIKMLLLSVLTWADYCPEYLYESESALKAYNFLAALDQNLRFKKCDVEIVLCDKSTKEKGLLTSPVAKVYIIDSLGREAYLPITFDDGLDLVHQDSLVNKRTFYYEKKDTNYEPELGRTEFYRFEIRKKWGSDTEIERIELGVYSTNTQLNHSSGNDSHWYICE